MIEYIGKAKLNLNYYLGEDFYSDGDIEDELLEIVQSNENLEDIIRQDNRWPILYHLSENRANIIEWYPFDKSEHVLEIGAGCGAITGTLSKLAKSVTCVELSKRRSLINIYRNKNCENVEIIVGDFNKIEFEQKFDVITLIGVLEYAPSFSKVKAPFHELLSSVKSLLKPGGKLLIAIENKYGMKYWAGAREDHTGQFFESLEQYTNSNRVKTFSKKELNVLLSDVGFEKKDFYYPMPDYKLPLQIFSDKRLPQVGELRNLTHNFDQHRVQLFSEEKMFDSIIENEEFCFFANSFLVIAE